MRLTLMLVVLAAVAVTTARAEDPGTRKQDASTDEAINLVNDFGGGSP